MYLDKIYKIKDDKLKKVLHKYIMTGEVNFLPEYDVEMVTNLIKDNLFGLFIENCILPRLSKNDYDLHCKKYLEYFDNNDLFRFGEYFCKIKYSDYDFQDDKHARDTFVNAIVNNPEIIKGYFIYPKYMSLHIVFSQDEDDMYINGVDTDIIRDDYDEIRMYFENNPEPLIIKWDFIEYDVDDDVPPILSAVADGLHFYYKGREKKNINLKYIRFINDCFNAERIVFFKDDEDFYSIPFSFFTIRPRFNSDNLYDLIEWEF